MKEAILYHRTIGQKISDVVTEFCGSWAFLGIFTGICVWWTRAGFDPYPYLALNMMLTVVSTFQSPLIMMAQNRQVDRDRETITLMLEKLERIEKMLDHEVEI